MIKGKLERLFRRIKRNWRSVLLLWLPAAVVVSVLGALFYSVMFSTDYAFNGCTRQLSDCVKEKTGIWRLGCSYQTAWCDVRVLWDKAAGNPIPLDLPGIPPVDEKADKELFEKMTSDEFLEERFKVFDEIEKDVGREKSLSVPEKEKLKQYMEDVRAKRLQFEKEMAERKEQILKAVSAEKNAPDELSGKTEK